MSKHSTGSKNGVNCCRINAASSTFSVFAVHPWFICLFHFQAKEGESKSEEKLLYFRKAAHG